MANKINSRDKQAMLSRNDEIDVFKGIAIVCVVLGHSGFPRTGTIYLFHMAIFFMASGYFFNNQKVATLRLVVEYICRKIISLYVPFVLFNGSLILFSDFLFKIHFLTYDPLFLEIGGDGALWGLQWPYYGDFKMDAIWAVLRFDHQPQLAGATWFLRVLFKVSVFHCLLMYMVSRTKRKAIQVTIMVMVVTICCVCAIQINSGASLHLINQVERNFFCCYLAFLLGTAVKKTEVYIRYDWTSACICAALLYLLEPLGWISLGGGNIYSLDFFLITSLAGWIMCRSIAHCTSGVLKKLLSYTGRHSLSIVLLHFLSFKIVTWMVILIRKDDILLLASFPHLDGAEHGLWILYTLAGVSVPLAINGIYRVIRTKLYNMVKVKK